VRFLGRADDQVKVRGFRVELGEIAAVLRAANEPQVLDALALARPLASGEPQIVAFVVRRAGQAPTPAGLLASVRAALPRYAHPAGLAVLDAFPLLPNGKVDRLALLALPVSTGTGAAKHELSAREQQLKDLWAELLGVQDVSVNESFYDLGGDSLTALRVLLRMQTLGLAPELCRGILQGKSIAELANADAANQGTNGPPPRDHQSRLLLNVLRGLLIVLLVLCHWIPPLLGRLPPSLLRAAGFSFALFNWPTPGFAIAFGMTLGFVYAPMYRQHPARVRALLWRGALFVAAGTLIYAAVQLLVNRLAVDWYFHPLGSVLTFYTLAMLSAPLWLELTATGAHPVEKALGLSVLLMLLHHAARSVHLSDALTFHLQPVLGKYSYLAMSSGALAGIAAGFSLKRRGLIPTWYALAGLGLVVLGLSWSWGRGRAGLLLLESKDVELEKWLVYGGLLLLVLGPLDRVLGWVLRVGQRCKACAQGVATLGQLALPICVLDFVSRDLGKLLELTGARSGARMLGTGLAFGLLAFALLRKTYRLYYGGEAAEAA
jgi:hypothetical protein